MAEPLTALDTLLLSRWADTAGIRDAIKELEERLGNHLNAVADRLRPWLKDRGFELYEVEARFAAIHVSKASWMKNRDAALVYVTVGSLLPFGYRRVTDEHPYVWLRAENLKEHERETLRGDLSARLGTHPGGWINAECNDKFPAGRYVTTHGDRERVELAQSDDAMEAFVKAAVEPMFEIATEIDAALGLARTSNRVKV